MKKIRFWGLLLVFSLLGSVFTGLFSAEEVSAEAIQDMELVFILDKSGSMHGLTDETIGSFNSVIESQRNSGDAGDIYVTTVMFNHNSEKVHDRQNIKDVKEITRKEYSPCGCTALLDAVGNTIQELSSNEAAQNHKVLFVIITDGYENSSIEFTRAQVKELIEEKSNENWEFLFLGANIDSFDEGGSIGISGQYTMNFEASSNGVAVAYDAVSRAIGMFRSGGEICLGQFGEMNK